VNTIARAIEGIAVRRSSDVDLFERALRGDSIAFSEAYRRYYDRVFAFCLSRLLSREAAKDAAQESFARALSANASGVTSPASWLFGIARHVCIDVARDAARGHPASAGDIRSDESVLPSERSAEDTALSKQAASKVLVALRKTNPRYRSALILREIHQQPMTDVAEALGVSLETAYTVMSRARDAFGKSYAEILNLPAPCSQAVELSYRRSGSGLTPVETATLDTHLGSCAKCRREAARVETGGRLGALLLLTPWASSRVPGLLERAAAALGSRPWPTHVLPEVVTDWTVPKVAAIVIAAVNLIALAGPTDPQAALSLKSAMAVESRGASQNASPTCPVPSGGDLAQGPGSSATQGPPAQGTQRNQVRAHVGAGGAGSSQGGQTAVKQQTAAKTRTGSPQSSGSGTQKGTASGGATAQGKSSGGSSSAPKASTSGGSSQNSGSGSGGSAGTSGGSGSAGRSGSGSGAGGPQNGGSSGGSEGAGGSGGTGQ
jgi:RNA polymerase sigma factor (sigma-70 family)